MEKQPISGLEEAVDLSRRLPQLGLHPEISLKNSQTTSVKKPQEQPIATDWEAARQRAIKQEPKTYKWGVFSALKDYLDGNL